MAESIEELREQLKEAKEEAALYKIKGAIGYYYELNRWVNDTVGLMRESGVKGLMKVTKDDDAKKFEKMMALIKNTKEWIDNMDEIKAKFGMTGDEQKDKAKPFIDRIADTRN